jgi:hypothetical protein
MSFEVSTPKKPLGSTQNLTNTFKGFMEKQQKNTSKTPLESIKKFCIDNDVSTLIFDYDDTIMKLPKNGLYESNFDKTRFQPFFMQLIQWALTLNFPEMNVCIVTRNDSSKKLDDLFDTLFNTLFNTLFPGKQIQIQIYNPPYPKGFTVGKSMKNDNDKETSLFDKIEIVSNIVNTYGNAMYFEDDFDLLQKVMLLENIACVHVTIGEHPSEQTDFYELHEVPKQPEILPVIGKKRSPPKKKIPDPTGMGTEESRLESAKEALIAKDDFKLKTKELKPKQTKGRRNKSKQTKDRRRPMFASDSEEDSSIDSIGNSDHSNQSSSSESPDWDRYMGIGEENRFTDMVHTNDSYGSPIHSSPEFMAKFDPKTGKKTLTQKQRTPPKAPIKGKPVGSRSNHISYDTPPKNTTVRVVSPGSSSGKQKYSNQLFSSDSDSDSDRSPKRIPKVVTPPRKPQSYKDKLRKSIYQAKTHKQTTESRDDMMADIKREKAFYSKYPKHQIVPRINAKFQYDDPKKEWIKMARNRAAEQMVLYKLNKDKRYPDDYITKKLKDPRYQMQDPEYFMPRRRTRSVGGKRRINKNKTRKLF